MAQSFCDEHAWVGEGPCPDCVPKPDEGSKGVGLFTVVCKEYSGRGTAWIGAVQAQSMADAKSVGRQECATAWGWCPDDVYVVCVIPGDVDILWYDSPEDS